jgi:hypothetical protein
MSVIAQANTQSTGTNGAPANGSVVIDCKLNQVFYGVFLAVRDSHVQIERARSRASSARPAVARARYCAASTA